MFAKLDDFYKPSKVSGFIRTLSLFLLQKNSDHQGSIINHRLKKQQHA